MSRAYGTFFLAVLLELALIGPGLWGQDNAPLKARELFYKPLSAETVKPPAVSPGKVKTAIAKKPPVHTKPVEEKAPPVEVPSQGGALVNASFSPRPLGLKYTVVKESGDAYREVDPDAEFHSGDRIRVSVEANDAAYLYIVMQGSSGTWKLLFPNPAISGGNNWIERGKVYGIPPAGLPAFYFDETPGTEKVSLILTRTPEDDLEKLIYSTGERNKTPGNNKTMMAKNADISGALMGQVERQMLSRDLVFEKADGNTPAGKNEKAMYVATPDTSPKARVFVDLKLIHK